MITTIQLNEKIKIALDRLKTNRETYEDVIVGLMRVAEFQKRKQEDLLIEGCKVMAEESLKICKEWESTDATLDWDCDGLVPKKYLKDKS